MTDTVIERREVPEWVEKRLTSLGGLNPFGMPNYRVIWGGNRTHKVGGKFKKVIEVAKESMIIGDAKTVGVVTEVAEIRTLLKYHPFRWHLEKWISPEIYGSREDWYRDTWDEECQFHTQGDYPERGDYEHVFFLGQCPHMKPDDKEWCVFCKASLGEYIPLEENIHILEFQIKALQLSQGVSAVAEKAALFGREDQKRKNRNAVVMARVQNAMRPKLAVQPTSWQSGTNSRCSVPEPSMETPAPTGQAGFRQD